MKRGIAIGAALVLSLGASAIAFAGPASATLDPGPTLIQDANVWFQSFQRSGPDAPCVAPKELDIAWQADWPASQNVWTPSWAQWPNDGKGGWVCDRQITWSPAIYQRFF